MIVLDLIGSIRPIYEHLNLKWLRILGSKVFVRVIVSLNKQSKRGKTEPRGIKGGLVGY